MEKISSLEYTLHHNSKALISALRKLGYKGELSDVKHFENALKGLKKRNEKQFYKLVQDVHPDKYLFEHKINADGSLQDQLQNQLSESQNLLEQKPLFVEKPKTIQEQAKTETKPEGNKLSPQTTNLLIGAGITMVAVSLIMSIVRISK